MTNCSFSNNGLGRSFKTPSNLQKKSEAHFFSVSQRKLFTTVLEKLRLSEILQKVKWEISLMPSRFKFRTHCLRTLQSDQGMSYSF